MIYFVEGEGVAVDGAPGIDDVCEDEGDEERYVEHSAKGELAGRGVLHGERRLEVGCGGVVGGVVPSGEQEQDCDGDYHAETYNPEAALPFLVEQCAQDAEEHEHHTHEQQYEQRPHREEVVEVLVWFHEDDACLWVNGIAIAHEDVSHESKEQSKEEQRAVP